MQNDPAYDVEVDLQGQLTPVLSELIERLDLDDLTTRQQLAIASALVKAASVGSRIVVGIIAFELHKLGEHVDVEALALHGVDMYAETFDADDYEDC